MYIPTKIQKSVKTPICKIEGELVVEKTTNGIVYHKIETVGPTGVLCQGKEEFVFFKWELF